MLSLRPYQTELIDRLRTELRTGAKSVLVQLSTGGGKTVKFAHLCSKFCQAKQLAWVLVHRVELASQARAKLADYGCDESVDVHMITTVSKRLASIVAWPRWVIVDEAHHAASSTWAKVIAACQEHGASVIGYSATPERLDGRGLQMFDRLICGPSTRELQAGGYLARTKYFCPPSCDVTDWREAAVEAAARQQKVTGDAVATWQKHAPGCPTIVFCTSLAHCAEVIDAATLAGITAAGIDGTMATDERRKRIAALADGSCSWLVSCELISEGLDVPACKCVVLLRPTQSLALHLQQIGRALRPGGTAIILDHVGNCLDRLGFAETDRQWSLEGKTKSRGTKPVLRRCDRCYAAWEGVKLCCPNCGHTNAPAKNKRAIQNEDGELVEAEPLEKMPMPPAQLKLMRGMFARRMLYAHTITHTCGVKLMDWPCAMTYTEARQFLPDGCDLVGVRSQPVPRAEFGRIKKCAKMLAQSVE